MTTTGASFRISTKDEFQITEDGEPQTAQSFVLVHGGRIYNQLDAPPPPSSRARGIGFRRRAARPTWGSGRVLLLFVDDLHLD